MRTQANSESTSRRALLKGATATAAVAALPALAAGSQPDPIFAAIKEHCRAHQAWGEAA